MKYHNLLAKTIFGALISIFPFFAYGGDFLMQSQEIPGGIDSTQTPQLIGFGFDDNYEPAGVRWLLDSLKNKKNPIGKNNPKTYDGTPVRVSFFCNTNNSTPVTSGSTLAKAYIDAAADGHEIANHTKTHLPNSGGANYTVAQWKKEMSDCSSELKSAGITATIYGFRTPYLEYNDNTFKALDSLKIKYDCSIESGYDTFVDGTNFFWPYTLDSASDDDETVGRHPGLWEMPAYYVLIPPELRAQIKKKVPFFDTAFGKCTGLDYNMLGKIAQDSCMGMNKDEYLKTLKYNLDQRLKGNRAPLLFGAHSQFYTSQAFSDLGPPNITYQEMRGVIQDFINYALTKPDVRIVPIIKILEWCRNPVGLNNSGISASGNYWTTRATIACRNKTIFLQLPHRDKDRDVFLRLFDLQGRLISAQKYATTGLIQMKVSSLSAKGVYVLQILSGRDVIVDRILEIN